MAEPDYYRCPITLERMVDPVVAADGMSYERAAITNWLATHNTSPATNAVLAHRNLTPNLQLRQAIAAWTDQQSMQLEPHEVTVDRTRRLGAGNFGQVFQGTLTVNGSAPRAVAVKMFTAAGDITADEARALFEREVVPLRRASLQCLHVTKFYGHCIIDGQLCLVMKLYTRSLLDVIRTSPDGRVPEATAVSYAIQLFTALAELQEAQIVSRDVKPENLLLDGFGGLFLADLGIALVMTGTLNYVPANITGTFAYMAPEMFNPDGLGGISYPADVWAAACVLLQTLMGTPPFAMQNIAYITGAVLSRRTPVIDTMHVSTPLRDLVRRCFSFEQQTRPTAAEMVQLLHTHLQTLGSGGAVGAVGGALDHAAAAEVVAAAQREAVEVAVAAMVTAQQEAAEAVDALALAQREAAAQREAVVLAQREATEAVAAVLQEAMVRDFAAQQELAALRAQIEAMQLHEHPEAGSVPTPAWTFVNGATSQLLNTPTLTSALAGMFPFGRVPRELRLLLARDGGIDVKSFEAAMLNVDGGVLVILRNTDGFIFGAALFDRGQVLSDTSRGKIGTLIPGDPDNFLFRMARGGGGGAASGGDDAPTKLIKTTGGQYEQQGLLVGRADAGLWVGGGPDLCTFCGDGTRANYCIPSTFTAVAPGYPQGQVTNKTLAGARDWTPLRSEVYAMTAFH